MSKKSSPVLGDLIVVQTEDCLYTSAKIVAAGELYENGNKVQKVTIKKMSGGKVYEVVLRIDKDDCKVIGDWLTSLSRTRIYKRVKFLDKLDLALRRSPHGTLVIKKRGGDRWHA